MRLLEVTFLKDTGLKVAGWLRPSSVVAAAPQTRGSDHMLALEVEHLGPVSIVWDHQGEAFLNELTGVPRNKEKP